MSRIKKFFRNPWVVSIGSGLALLLIDKVSGFNIISQAFKIILIWLKVLQGWLSYKLSLGFFLMVVVICSVIIVVIKILRPKLMKNNPKFLEYTEDLFQGILYQWKYNYKNGKYKIGETVAYCPSCRLRIVHDKCQTCGAIFLLSKKDRQEREALIRHGIAKKYQINEFQVLGN